MAMATVFQVIAPVVRVAVPLLPPGLNVLSNGGIGSGFVAEAMKVRSRTFGFTESMSVTLIAVIPTPGSPQLHPSGIGLRHLVG